MTQHQTETRPSRWSSASVETIAWFIVMPIILAPVVFALIGAMHH